MPGPPWRQRFRRRLRTWYSRHARDLPWRPSPGPYHTWVSEIMLQQTQVATVIPYFHRFVQRFPSVSALAEADEQEVLRCWEGLGYYRRARQMHRAARQIRAEYDGQFPTSFDQVLELPGIGRYTAGAILSIALNQRHPILEANTTRLLSRLLAFDGDPAGSVGQKTLWAFAEALLPRRRCGDFNQGLMELGSTICTPGQPSCDQCPVAALCPTRAQGRQKEIPRAKPKTAYAALREAAVIIRRDGKVLLRLCQAGERWAGLWDFPRFAVTATSGKPLSRELATKVADLTGFEVSCSRRIATLKHGVTRYRITLHCHEATYRRKIAAPARRSRDQQRWVTLEQLEDFPLSVTGRKISRLLGGGGNSGSAR